MGLKQHLKAALPDRLRTRLRHAQRTVSSAGAAAWHGIFHAGRLRRLRGQHLLLNLGCGSLHQPGWVNVDRLVAPGVYYADLSRGLPLAAGAVRHIHCEHFLEYLEYDTALHFLRECHRVLESSGTVRLIVNDAERFFRAYAQNDEHFFHELRHLGGAVRELHTPLQVINQMFRMGGSHQWSWDFQSLSMALEECGFRKVQRSSHHDVAQDLDIDGTDWWRPFESLYVNAVK